MTAHVPVADPIALYALFDTHGIAYQRCDHPAVFTAAEAEQMVPPLPGAKAKNLFVRDKAGARFLLVVVPYAKRVDLAALGATLGTGKLRFASAPELLAHLAITPGAVSLLALFADAGRRVEPVIDASVWQAEALQCHPMVNTSTLVLPKAGLERFLALTGHVPRVLEVPSAG